MVTTGLHVSVVDPRDQRWEIDKPAYRVYFAQALSGHSASIDERRVAGARSVAEVLDWANNDGREYTLWVEVPDEDGVGLVLLFGEDPNRI